MTLDVQALSILASVSAGIWFGLSFDTYDRLSGSRKSFKWTRVLNDILFWAAQMLIYFFVLLNVNNGEIRFYLFLALLLGFAAYKALLENIYRSVLERVIRFCTKAWRMLVHLMTIFLVNPTKGILKLVYRFVMIMVLSLWRVVSFFIYWTIRPVVMLGRYADLKMGQPFKKKRQQISAFVKKVYGLLKRHNKNGE